MSVRVVILAGGLGTRLMPYTTILPKPLLPLGNISVLEHLIQKLVKHGMQRITISVGYLGHLVKAVVGDGNHLNAKVDYVEENEPRGTAGCLSSIIFEHFEDIVLVVNGDTFTDFDFNRGVVELEESKASCVIVCAKRRVQSEFGVVSVDEDNFLLLFEEKPISEQLVSTGINYFRIQNLHNYLRQDVLSMPELIWDMKVKGSEIVKCLPMDEIWFDLGREQDLKNAFEYVSNSSAESLPDLSSPLNEWQ